VQLQVGKFSQHSPLKVSVDVLAGIFVAVFSAIALFIIVANPPRPLGTPWPLYFRIMEADAPLFALGLMWLIARHSDAVTTRFPFIDKTWFRILLALGVFVFCAFFSHVRR